MTLRTVDADHLLPGISALDVETSRLRMRMLVRDGDEITGDSRVLVLVHGNVSSSLFYQRLMLALAEAMPDIVPVAPDLRGYGETEPAPIDASRGLRDHADDLVALLDTLGVRVADLMGWSMGGGVVARLATDDPTRVRSLVLQAPVSPYGFGATTDVAGTLATGDAAGTGGGGANPRFVELLAAGSADGEGTRDEPEGSSPRATLRAVYVAPRAQPWPDEDMWVASMCTTRVGPDHYPGDATASENWPGFAPGRRGVLNSMAPLFCRWDDLVGASPKPPVLWVHGDADRIVSDASALDLAVLGAAGILPGYPGAEMLPPQPMIAQTRTVLDAYRDSGGTYRELSLPGIGHSPHLEAPERVLAALVEHLLLTTRDG
ncbi:alpha/beta fold hydrolase [Mobilicoccus massiliensis]|uniref:alpha/beta fold hydrolase n=1 Tax=Mobilicoccus massiliensis TaxID=1522310 RepID=UPI00058B0284|nr:alpha/beta hydrolase [Mobilicoccus massiliensis]